METFAVFSGGMKDRINMIVQGKSDQESKKENREGDNLGARNTCPADSKELGSNDCMSVTQIQKVMLVFHCIFLCCIFMKQNLDGAASLYSHWSCSITSLKSAWM